MTPWDLFWYIVAAGCGLMVLGALGLIAWAMLNVAADLVQKWAKQ